MKFVFPTLKPDRASVESTTPSQSIATNSGVAIDYDKDPFPESTNDTGSENYRNDGYSDDLEDDSSNDSCYKETDAHDLDGQRDGGEPEPRPIDTSPTVVVHKSDTRIIIHWNAATGEVNVENGPPIDHPRLQALLCDAQIDVQHVDINDVPTGLITTAHHANWRQDRYLAHRDGVCRYPDCPGIGKTQAHHFFDDRPERVTCVTKMINLCNRTHNETHDGNLHITGDPEGVITFTHTDGRQIHSAARTAPPQLRPKPTPFQKIQLQPATPPQEQPQQPELLKTG